VLPGKRYLVDDDGEVLLSRRCVLSGRRVLRDQMTCRARSDLMR
jgi:hypothetical protein